MFSQACLEFDFKKKKIMMMTVKYERDPKVEMYEHMFIKCVYNVFI